MSGATFSAIVLAGSRGPDCPVAAAAKVSHKALAPVGGRAMVERVVTALRAEPTIGRVAVMIERPELLQQVDSFGPLVRDGFLLPLAADSTPSRSALAGFGALGGGRAPVLMTTADNCLLTPQMVQHFATNLPGDVDAAVGLARLDLVMAAYPATRRTGLRFRGDARCGCNLFAFLTPRARAAIGYWSRIEQKRKRPLAMLRELGLLTAGLYAANALSLSRALGTLERRTGTRLAAVDMPFAEAAIDVDTTADLALAEQILAAREAP